MAEKITTRSDDYSQWYLDIVKQAGLAENSDVRGCMVIKPHGYAIWEKMQRALDRMFKDTGHVNAYFPLFIPKSLPRQGRGDGRGLRQGMRRRHALSAQGRCRRQGARSSIPRRSSRRELIIRPTSETIIWNTYKNWIQSYRDLPLLDQPVVQRRPLGDAHPAVPAHGRVPLAGRAHRPRHPGGGRGGDAARCSRSTATSPRSGWRCRC